MKQISSLRKAGRLAVAALALAAAQAHAGIVNVSEPEFGNAKVLDFESAPTGNVSRTDAIFSNFGISAVTTVASDFTDGFGSRANASKALWVNETGLAIAAPGGSNFADTVSYTIDFALRQTRFGFGVHDQNFTISIELFDGLTSVGTTTLNTGGSADLTMLYFASSSAFDRVVINSTGVSGGFAIDNLTLAAVPAPASVALFAFGALGLVARRKR